MRNSISQFTMVISKKIKEKIKDKLLFKKKNGSACVYCGCCNPLLITIDHIVPTSRGGPDTEDNKQVCCTTCNQLKGSLNDEEFKEYLKALIILHKLCKINIPAPNVKINFNQSYHPLNLENAEDKNKKS